MVQMVDHFLVYNILVNVMWRALPLGATLQVAFSCSQGGSI